MRLLRIFPEVPRFRFMHWRHGAFSLAVAMTVLTLVLVVFRGLNPGLDFTGGVLIEARAGQPVDLADLRQRLSQLSPGELSLQTYGSQNDVLIRVQDTAGGAPDQARTVTAVRTLLPAGFDIRRTEIVGPQVSQELLRNGIVAAVLAVLLIGVYVWFRFEWQFGVCAVVTTFHDVFATVGLLALLRSEFNVTLVAALLTIAGYSINDTVVVFDRIRENLRLYKKMDLAELIDLSVNQTLSRTVLTSGTTLIAVLALLTFGGPVLRDFSLALTWGILIGTVSSIYVAAPLILYLRPSDSMRRTSEDIAADEPVSGTPAQ